jgi:hypothetical protein
MAPKLSKGFLLNAERFTRQILLNSWNCHFENKEGDIEKTIKKFIERYLTSIYLRIDQLSINTGSISQTAENPQDMAQILDILHKSYSTVLSSTEDIVLELRQLYDSDTFDSDRMQKDK